MTKDEIKKYLAKQLNDNEAEIYLDVDDYKIILQALEQPIRKVSKWVPIWDKDHIVIYTYQCPECGIMMNVNTSHYCPGCGAKMESEGE